MLELIISIILLLGVFTALVTTQFIKEMETKSKYKDCIEDAIDWAENKFN